MESITFPPMFILLVLEEKRKKKLCNVVVFSQIRSMCYWDLNGKQMEI
jgi:hypothetical protein